MPLHRKHRKYNSDMADNRYMQRGVSAAKEDVHAAIKNIDKGLYPQAFCKIIPDILGGDPDYCNIMHADGAGTKSALAYMYWKETGDLSVWKGIAQDAIVMNTDDLLCVGAVDNIGAAHAAGDGAVDNDGTHQVAHVGCLTASGPNAYTHVAQFAEQLVGAVDDG